MQNLMDAGVVLVAYVFGSIPFGLLIVKLMTGKDIRHVESGRTGGTNALRAAGCSAGLLTALFDVLKGVAAVLIATAVSPGNPLTHVLAPVAAILGHNYSMFLPEFNQAGRVVRLRGGAGGAPSAGGAVGLWPPAILFIVPVAALVFFSFGIASVTTLSVGLIALVIFAVLAWRDLAPWTYLLFPVAAELLLIWALRPNIKRLLRGEERIVKYSLAGVLRARRERAKQGRP